MLIVSLATMVAMQVKLSKQSLNAFKAKQAAKFAVYEDFGQVQTALGPDRRITANASMLSDSIHSGSTAIDSDSTFNWWQSPISIRRQDAEEITGAVANFQSAHKYLLKTKGYSDLTGNNVNHPNDFLIRLYAQVVASKLTTLD